MPILLRLLAAALASLEPDTAGRLGAWLGDIAWCLGLRRGVVRSNLALALDPPAWQRARWSRRCYRAMGASMAQLWSYARGGPGRQPDWEPASPTWVRRMAREHPAAVCLTLHGGNWDVAAHACRSLFDRVLVYATPQRHPAFDALLNLQRQALGMEVVLVRDGDRRGALSVIRILRAGHAVVGMLADQGPRPGVGVAARFFGHPTWCHHGPVTVARRAGVPILPFWTVRCGWNRYRLFCGRPFSPAEVDDATAVQWTMDLLAAMIATVPGQYFWHHRRFKRRAQLEGPAAAVPARHAEGPGLLVARPPSRPQG